MTFIDWLGAIVLTGLALLILVCLGLLAYRFCRWVTDIATVIFTDVNQRRERRG